MVGFYTEWLEFALLFREKKRNVYKSINKRKSLFFQSCRVFHFKTNNFEMRRIIKKTKKEPVALTKIFNKRKPKYYINFLFQGIFTVYF